MAWSNDSRRGAIQFLRTAEAVLQSPRHLLAVTPQSRFADVRERPVRFEAGLGHLATRGRTALYSCRWQSNTFSGRNGCRKFWCALANRSKCGGEAATAFEPADWTELFEEKLAAAQDALAGESRRRDPGGLSMDPARRRGSRRHLRLVARVQGEIAGEPFNREHGRK